MTPSVVAPRAESPDAWRGLPRPAVNAAVLLIGVVMAVAAGAAIGRGLTLVGVALALVPVALLLLHYPFGAILLWLAALPYFLQISVEAGPAVWAFHRLMVPAMLVIVAVYSALGIRRSAFRLHLYDLAIGAFLVLGVANTLLLSPNPTRMIIAFYDQVGVPVALFWLVRAIGFSRADLARLVVVGVVTILVQSLIGGLSWVAPSTLPGAWLGRAGERTAGTFGGPAPYTITLVFFALLGLHWAALTRRISQRILLGAVICVAFLGVFISLSRGSWLGAAVAFAGLVLLYPRIVVRLGLAVVLVGVILAIGPLQPLVEYAQVRLETESTIDDRIITNDAALRMIAERPVVGFGWANFERFDERYKRRVEEIPLKTGGSAHNTYLNLAAEMGLPGTALYFAPPAVLLATTISGRRRFPRGELLGWPLLVILWLALLDQFVVSNFLEMMHAYLWGTSLWWLTLGLIAVVIDQHVSDGSEPGSTAAR